MYATYSIGAYMTYKYIYINLHAKKPICYLYSISPIYITKIHSYIHKFKTQNVETFEHDLLTTDIHKVTTVLSAWNKPPLTEGT